MQFADNPNFRVAFESKVHNLKIYQPSSVADYDLQRKVAASAQDIFSSSGATAEILELMMNRIIKACNEEYNKDTLRTDISAYANNILYRLKYPVDEHCAVRMGAILTFIDGEEPDQVNDAFTRRKIAYAMGDGGKTLPDPDLYSFFLHLGIVSTPSYQNFLQVLDSLPQYLMDRQIALQSLTPQKV